MEEAALPMLEQKYSPWTATQEMWSRSLDQIEVKVAPASQPSDARELEERLKPFDTTVEPESLVRLVYY